LGAALVALAVAAVPAGAQNCPFTPAAWNSLDDKQLLPYATTRYGDQDLKVDVPAPAERVTTRLVGLMAECRLPIVTNTGGVIAARFPREMGWFGQYEISAHAVVTPNDAGGSTVRMYAEETSYRGAALNPSIDSRRVGVRNMGRSGNTWWALQRIAATLDADPTLRAPAADTTAAPAFVGSASRKVFMTAGCSLVPQLEPLDRVVFRTEAEARAAGYARSGAPGC
jgi:hypothetical protein